MISGRTVTLRPLSVDDMALLYRWFFAPDVLKWLQISEDPPEFRSLDGVQARFERLQADPHNKMWRIDTAEGRPIGQIELLTVHPLHRRAEMHILIGEDDLRGRGFGTQAVQILLQYAFKDLDLRRVYLIVDEDNRRAVRCFEKAGLAREGLLRGHRVRNGQPMNMFLMGVLREDLGLYSGANFDPPGAAGP
jgi:diamine N-acetyltransferase